VLQIIPQGVYPVDLYPWGYVVNLIISPRHIMIAFMFAILIRDIFLEKIKFKIHLLDIIMILFYFWIIFSDIYASQRLEISLPVSLLGIEMPILYFYLRLVVVDKINYVKFVVPVIFTGLVVQSLISFLQFMNSSPLYKSIESQVGVELFGLVPDELMFRFRPVGTFEHANMLGDFLSWAILITFPFVAIRKRLSNFYLSLLLIGLISLVITLSRSAWLGFVVGFYFTLFILNNLRNIKIRLFSIKNFIVISLLGVLLMVLFILPRAINSIYTFIDGGGGGDLRGLQIRESLNLIIQNPIFGVGTLMDVPAGINLDPRGFYSQVPLSVHNYYLLVAVEHGIPAIILFAVFVVLSLKSVIKWITFNKVSETWLYALGSISGAFSVLMVGLFQPFLSINYLILGLVPILNKIINEKNKI
jgi:O-antigen ligase